MDHLTKSLASIAALSLATCLSACSTPNLQTNLDEGPKTALLFDYQVNGSDKLIPPNGCALKMKNLTLDQEFDVNVGRDSRTIMAELPPGRYASDHLVCSLTNRWNIDGLFAKGFTIEANRINYAGKIILNFSHEDLVSIRLGNRAENTDSLRDIFQNLSPAEQKQLVSAYTSRPITQDMLSAAEPAGIRLSVRGPASAKNAVNPLMDDLKFCNNQAAINDPVLIGQLALSARYKRGQSPEVTQKPSPNAFSKSFQSCVESSMRKFHASGADNFEVEMNF